MTSLPRAHAPYNLFRARLNLVERFFTEITRKHIRRGAFASVAELEATIHDDLLRHNAEPNPFVGTKSAEVILKKERRALDALDIVRRNQTYVSEQWPPDAGRAPSR